MLVAFLDLKNGFFLEAVFQEALVQMVSVCLTNYIRDPIRESKELSEE